MLHFLHPSKGSLPFFIIILVIITLPITTLTLREGKYETVAMSGVYFEEQEEVDLYDSVAAVVFEFPKPEWLQQFPFFLGYPCTSDKYAEASLCPIFYYLSKQLAPQLEEAMEVSTVHIPPTDVEVKFECNEVSNHFPTFRIRGERMDEYLDKLVRCTNGKVVRESLSDPAGEGHFRTIYDKMVRRFMAEFHNRLPTANRENKASELNHRLGMTSIAITHLLALKDLFSNAVSECKSGFIPESLIPPDKLRIQLERLQKEIYPEGEGKKHQEQDERYKFTIPHTGPQISRYYKAQLADCAMTEEKLIIRVLVPLTVKRLTPSTLIRIKSVPFHTQTDHHQLCTIKGLEKGKFYNLGVEKAGSIIISQAMEISCDGSHFRLCKIPPQLTDIVDSDADCARAIITQEFDASDENKANVISACKLSCEKLDTDKFPIVVRSRDSLGTIFVLMNPDLKGEDVFMECEKKDDSVTLKGPVTGALALTLPCKCKLVFKARTILPDPATCKEYYVANAIPYHWEGSNVLAKK